MSLLKQSSRVLALVLILPGIAATGRCPESNVVGEEAMQKDAAQERKIKSLTSTPKEEGVSTATGDIHVTMT